MWIIMKKYLIPRPQSSFAPLSEEINSKTQISPVEYNQRAAFYEKISNPCAARLGAQKIKLTQTLSLSTRPQLK
jgi:hypothetical protein